VKKQYLIIIIFLIFEFKGFTQEVHFSQFFASPLYLAPSFAGTSAGTRISYNFRDQWPAIPKTFISTAFSIDHNFRNMKSGLGLLVFADQAGEGNLGLINAGLIYSYDINVTPDIHIRPGFNFQYARAGVNIGKLYSIKNIGSGGLISGSAAEKSYDYRQYFDFTFSTIAYSKLFWGGITLDHLFMPDEALTTIGSQSRIPVKISIYGGGKIISMEDFHSKREESLSGVFLFRKQQINTQLDLGFYWTRTPMIIGMYYRGIPFGKTLKSSDAIVFLVGYKIEDVSVGYSYDYTISSLAGTTGGAHEISVIYEFNKVPRVKKKKWAPVPCPTF